MSQTNQITEGRAVGDFTWAVLLCFLFSGVSGLIYQVIWVRQLELIFGTTTFAASTVLTAFMAGLAGGSYWFGKRAAAWRNPLKLYGLLEIGIGLYGLAIPHIFPALPSIYRPMYAGLHLSFVFLTVVRFVLTLAVLIIPTALMGATLPVLAGFYAPKGRSIGLKVGTLYSINTFGAVLGASAGGFVLIPALGMRLTSYTAAAINICLGLVALVISRIRMPNERPSVDEDLEPATILSVSEMNGPGKSPEVPGPAVRAQVLTRLLHFARRNKKSGPTYAEPTGETGQVLLGRAGATTVLAAFATSGFVALSYEVIWSRVLALVIGSSVYAFSIMLATFLIGLAAGSTVASRIVDRLRRPVLAFGIIEFGVGLTTLAGAWVFDDLPFAFMRLYKLFAGSHIALLLLLRFAVSSLIMAAPTLLLGALFPLVVRILHGDSIADQEGSGTSRTVGNVYAINTVGAIAGAFASGFLLIPWLGVLGSLRLCVGINLLIAAVLLLMSARITRASTVAKGAGEKPRRERARENRKARRTRASGSGMLRAGGAAWVGVAAALLLALTVLLFPPPWDVALMSSGVYRYAPQIEKLSRADFLEFFSDKSQGETLFYKEGITATVAVQRQGNGRVLKVNGKPDASTGGDLPTQILIGSLPLMVRDKTDNCLLIGLGSGITLGSIEQFPIKEVTCVELEPAVIEASHYFDDINHKPLGDPRLHLIANDGRNFIETTRQKFDVIVSEPSNPWLTGAASLFTLEYFRKGAARLTDDGVFSQWLQIYEMAPEDVNSLIGTFRMAFPNSYLFRGAEGDLMLLGAKHELRLDMNAIWSHFAEPNVAADLDRIHISTPADLVSRLYMGPVELEAMTASSEINTDDNALIEFNAPRRVGISDDTVGRNVTELLAHTASPLPYVDGDTRGADPPAKGLVLTEPAEKGAPPDFLLDAAVAAIRRDDIGRAEQFVSYSLDLADTARAHSIEGEILSSRGNDNAALDEWKQALALDPNHLYTLMDLGKYYLQKEDLASAEPYLDRAIQADSNSARAHHLRGLAFQAGGDAAHAVEQYRLALHDAEYTRSFPTFFLNFGVALMGVNLYDESAEMLEEYEKLAPQDGEGHYQLGVAYEVLDERSAEAPYTDRAIDELKQSLETKPDRAMAH
ncbi:MAG TPA: fused MFS/spermidine synthase, partial [Blastocatellia bacterium]